MEQHSLEIVGAVGAAIMSTVIGPIIFEYVKGKFIKPKKDMDSIREEIKECTIINDELLAIREHLDGDRIWITQFHNGGHFLNSKKSVQKFSITFEDVKPGVSSARLLLKEIPISLQTRAMNEILDNGYIFISNFNDNRIPSFGLKPLADATGTVASYVIGLYDIGTNKCIGTLGVDYRDPKLLSSENEEFLLERASRLSGFLSILLQSK